MIYAEPPCLAHDGELPAPELERVVVHGGELLAGAGRCLLHAHPMDPTLTLLVARWGADQLCSALLGEDLGALVGDLYGALLGTVERMDVDQQRLTRIEGDLHVLTQQRYDVALSSASRYLSQSLLTGRAGAARTRDLERADDLLVEAAHAATSSMRRAQAERMLVLVRLAMGDAVGARHASQVLQLAAGDAVAEIAKEPGDKSLPDRMLLAAHLLADAVGAEELVDPSRAVRSPSSVTLSKHGRGVVLEVGLGDFSFAGVKGVLSGVTLGGVADGAYITKAVARLSPARSLGGLAWLGGCDVQEWGHQCPDSPYTARYEALRPGAEAALEYFYDAPEPGMNTCLVVAGLCFTAQLPVDPAT